MRFTGIVWLFWKFVGSGIWLFRRFVNSAFWLFFGLLVTRMSYVHLFCTHHSVVRHLSPSCNLILGISLGVIALYLLAESVFTLATGKCLLRKIFRK